MSVPQTGLKKAKEAQEWGVCFKMTQKAGQIIWCQKGFTFNIYIPESFLEFTFIVIRGATVPSSNMENQLIE